MAEAGVEVGAAPRAGRLALFSSLRSFNYRLYWLGQFLAVVGQTMEFVALAWLVYDLTHSALSLGATGLAQALPRMALVLVGGAVADRVDRRQLLVVAQGLSALLYSALGTLVVLGVAELWHALFVAFCLGSVRAFDSPSRAALLPQMVAREDIPNAVALGNLAWDLPRMIGPASAGVLIAVIGIGPTLFVASLGYLTSAILYSLLRLERGERASSRGLARDLLGGVDYIRRNPLFYTLIGMTFFNSAFGMSYSFMLPIFARDILQVGSQGLGLFHTAAAIGATVGAFVAAAIAGSHRRSGPLLGGSAAFGALLVGFAFSQWFPLSLGLLFLAGLANNLYMNAIATILQLRVPDEYRARVMGVYTITWSLQSLGGMSAGAIAEYAGPSFALALGGCLVVAMTASAGALLPQVRRV